VVVANATFVLVFLIGKIRRHAGGDADLKLAPLVGTGIGTGEAEGCGRFATIDGKRVSPPK
jgi:hypothetical protein